MPGYKTGVKKAYLGGLSLGVATAMSLVVLTIQFWCAAAIASSSNPEDPTNILFDINIVRFATFAMSQANQFDPSAVVAIKAAKNIFTNMI